VPNFDAILILGGGVREGGELPPWAAARFDLALEMQSGEPLVCLSAGTTHRPPPLEEGFPISESVAGARYLMLRGVAPDQIRIESVSYDTIGNAYFSRLLHVDPSGWCRLLVITSAFHMPRTRAIFEWVYGFEKGKYQLVFAESPDRGLTPEARESRIRREQQGRDSFERTRSRLHSLSALHRWIWTAHDAYSAAGRRKMERPQDTPVLETY
jgi:hypothetical protein